MARMKAIEAAVRVLEKEGVVCAFGVCAASPLRRSAADAASEILVIVFMALPLESALLAI